MRVLLAPDSFKGTITAVAAVAALQRGWESVDRASELVPMPLADGGEGTLEAFAAAVPGAVRVPIRVIGPDGVEIDASWLRLPPTGQSPGGVGVVELASTSGIELLDGLRPWDAHTLGFGQAVAAALDAGVTRLVVGIGSSASTDGGSGFLRALGARFLDASGVEVPLGAGGLGSLARVDLDGMRASVDTLVITDVTNPLVGPRGAAAVFGPQKGLRVDELGAVDQALVRYAQLLAAALEQAPNSAAEGSGAAGGTGYGLLVWGAKLIPGAAEIARLLGFDRALEDADLVVTGEGSYDGQSGAGKVPGFVGEAARDAGVRVALVAGQIDPDADVAAFDAALSLTEIAGSASAAMESPAQGLQAAGRLLAAQFLRPQSR